MQFLNEITNILDRLQGEYFFWAAARFVLIMVAGIGAAKLISAIVDRVGSRRASKHKTIIYRKLAHYGVLLLAFIAALNSAGIQLTVLLGAAGILTVALGFASQTSASNIISGIFLLGERPFEIGDVIKLGERTGEVIAIDMLSVKLRTFDNLYVRIPNENLLKSEIVNMTKHPIRRLDIPIRVAYKEDANRVKRILVEAAENNPLVLDEPKPTFLFLGFGHSSLELQFSVWVARENFWTVAAPMKQKVKEALQKADIEIPFPHRTLHIGSATNPFPIKIVSEWSEPGDVDDSSEPFSESPESDA